MLSYAGTNLILPTGKISAWIEKNIDPRDATPWVHRAFPGKNLTGIAQPTGFQVPPKIEVGRLRWYTGASRWAYGHFLASANMVNTIRQVAYANGMVNALPFVMGLNQTNPDGSTVNNLSTTLFMLPPTPLSGYRGVNGLYLLTLVDKRYFWWQQPVPASFAIGCVAHTTWNYVITQLAGAVGEKVTISNIPNAYASPDQSLALVGEVVPPVLDAACWNVGCKLVVDYLGNVYCQSYGDALPVHRANVMTYGNHLGAGGPRNSDT